MYQMWRAHLEGFQISDVGCRLSWRQLQALTAGRNPQLMSELAATAKSPEIRHPKSEIRSYPICRNNWSRIEINPGLSKRFTFSRGSTVKSNNSFGPLP